MKAYIIYKLSVTAEGIQTRKYYYDEEQSTVDETPVYRTDEEDIHWIKPEKVKIGELVNRTVVCFEAGIPDAIQLLYTHFSKQLELKEQEVEELRNKVKNLKHYIDGGELK